ncbi:glycosyltransferase family 2 protein [Xanthovirga aplysinae]|uniref:glycosyltransferase family 2 protein n=1 Tax=Xanthovirga aplysinae TaxID=2529853 RepID=UPI0012BCEAB2|nr:glycosyltransferase family 2 protein [Xanthovirga aplysinae]MTI32051.1 glycosyltransferase family 2 protein [Xanthovirga aplysinae]
MRPVIKVIIPAFNEENSIGKVLDDLPKDLVQEIVVVNNASTDKTALAAKNHGATVIHENRKGYGSACLKGINYIKAQQLKPNIVVFIDADYSDHPEELPQLINPIVKDGVDLVIGSRALGAREKGAMTPQQIFGNWLAARLVRLLYRTHFTDLGPFRAIKYEKLLEIEMKDKDFGWTVEMQLKAAKYHLKCAEIPVTYRRRVGVSKISGTVKGTIMAGYKIIWTIFKYL